MRLLERSLKEVWSNKVDYFFLFFQLLYFSRLIRLTFTDSYLVIHLVITFLFVLFSGRFKKVKYLVWIILVFGLISTFPIFLFGFSTTLYGGYSIRLIIAFLIAVYFGRNFLIYFENIVYVLAFVSLPLFLLQVVMPEAFTVFDGLTRLTLHHEGIGTGSSYFFIFFLNGSAQLRNSGFLSEPSLYGIVLAWASLINLYLYKFKFNNKLFVFIVAILTTFSIGAYGYLLLFLALYFRINFKERYLGNIISITSVLVILFLLFSDTELVDKNISMMNRKIVLEDQQIIRFESRRLEQGNISRVMGAKIDLNAFINWPLGYGLNKQGFIDKGYSELIGGSPNGLSSLIVKWGIGLVILLFISARKLVVILNSHMLLFGKYAGRKEDFITKILSMSLFILPLAGYSLFNQPFMLTMLIWPFLYTKDFKIIYKGHFYVINNQLHLNFVYGK